MTGHNRLARPLGRLVPSMRMLIRASSAPRSGFTLIEIMVAITISTLIILCAVSCFRMISKAIASANAMSNANSLLRTGLQLAWQDVDYWHSYADPGAPYEKTWTRLPTGMGSASVTQQNIWRRPFQPIRYSPRTDPNIVDTGPNASDPVKNATFFNAQAPTLLGYNDETDNSVNTLGTQNNYWLDPYNRADYVPNPNAMLAHDTRSISREALRQMTVAELEDTDDYDRTAFGMGGYMKGTARLAQGDYTLVEATDARDYPGMVNPKYPVNAPVSATDSTPGPLNVAIPLNRLYCAGPTYSVLEQNELDPNTPLPILDTVYENIPLNPGVNIYQPLLWTSLFQRLSYVAYDYMPPGTPFLYTDQSGRTADTDSVPLPPCLYNTSSDFYGGYNSLVWERDWAIKQGNSDLASRMGMAFVPEDSQGGHSARAIEAVPFRTTWPMVQGLSALQVPNFDGAAYSYPFVDILGTSSSEAWITGITWESGDQFEAGDQTRIDEQCISQTVWLPYNITDWDKKNPDTGTDLSPQSPTKSTLTPLDYVSKPNQAPSMTTSIMRYGKVGGAQEFCVVRIAVDDPVSGRRIEMPCIPFGTTFRGARQHWRLYGAALDANGSPPPGMRFAPPAIQPNPANNPVGDYYDAGAGPYYVQLP